MNLPASEFHHTSKGTHRTMKQLTQAAKDRILATIAADGSLSTKDFEDLGYSFEAFLRYGTLSPERTKRAHAALRTQLGGK